MSTSRLFDYMIYALFCESIWAFSHKKIDTYLHMYSGLNIDNNLFLSPSNSTYIYEISYLSVIFKALNLICTYLYSYLYIDILCILIIILTDPLSRIKMKYNVSLIRYDAQQRSVTSWAMYVELQNTNIFELWSW